ncbi:MAG: hypothetical protein B6244_01415 [Candidatus Cloacimonetes bacterium 4572_55]|nr:MAG: hypothetical protein B6244_01415 [Candidatus Cloacimonetes bacterium 4572_55]
MRNYRLSVIIMIIFLMGTQALGFADERVDAILEETALTPSLLEDLGVPYSQETTLDDIRGIFRVAVDANIDLSLLETHHIRYAYDSHRRMVLRVTENNAHILRAHRIPTMSIFAPLRHAGSARIDVARRDLRETLLSQGFEDSQEIPSGWTTSNWSRNHWHISSSECGLEVPELNQEQWAYFGDSQNCDFDLYWVYGTLSAPSIAIPQDAVVALLIYHSVYQGEGGRPYDDTFPHDAAWVEINGNQNVVDQVSSTSVQNVWETRVVNLLDYAGQSIQIDWKFDSNDGNQNLYLGWQIDYVSVQYSTDPNFEDCNNNNIPDEFEPDCNGNSVPDECDIADGTSIDMNGNGIPDECEVNGFDYGDAPAPYPTLSADNGAYHGVVEGIYLGNSVDIDSDGQPSDTAIGDDTDSDGDDEDGVEFETDLIPNELTIVTITGSPECFVNFWIDLNQDGDWDDDQEQIFIDESIGTAQDFTLPAGAQPGVTFARVRLTSYNPNGDLSPTGMAADGEVEDYQITIGVPVPTYDFGDAPSTFPTLLSDNGARHVINPEIYLGSGISAEDDGQPGSDADGDDLDDGVAFNTDLTQGEAASITVNSSVYGNLSAWIDWDGDGTWSGTEEEIFQDQHIQSGDNILSFDVPYTAQIGDTYIRFRFSTAQFISYAGEVPDGEVEDYKVSIQEVPPGYDFGDAPDPYPTLLQFDGARHAIGSGILLGQQINDEEDGQPSNEADADQYDDGVSTQDLNLVENTAPVISVAVENPTDNTATLIGWIDYNGDGSWGPATEQAGAQVEAQFSGSVELIFPTIPFNSSPATFARFRISSEASPLLSTGEAVDGEVEDYPVTISQPASIGDLVWLDSDADGLQDDDEIGFSDVVATIYREDDTPLDTVLTDVNGAYVFDNLAAGNYYLRFTAPSGYLFSPQDQGDDEALDSDVNPTNGKTDVISTALGQDPTHIDAGLYPVAFLGDFVWQDSDADGIQDSEETGLSGVSILLYDETDDLIGTALSDQTGSYQFNTLTPGIYSLKFLAPDNYNITLQDQGNDDAVDSDVDPTTGKIESIDLSPGENNAAQDAGFYADFATVGDRVWHDLNADGFQDPSELGAPDITVRLYDAQDVLIDTALSQSDGSYQFSEVIQGDYYLQFVLPDHYIFSPANQSAAGDTSDSDANIATGKTDIFTLGPGDVDTSLDAGVYQWSSVRPSAWHDLNADGIRDQNESGISGITIALFDDTDDEIGVGTTDSQGTYTFENKEPGEYYLQATIPESQTITLQDQGDDDRIDSDADQATGRMPAFLLISATFDTTHGVGVNDKPIILTTGSHLDYVEGDGAVAVDPSLTLSDDNPGDTAIDSAKVWISGNYAQNEDILGFSNQRDISGVYANGELILQGTASEADYQAALRGVTYENIAVDSPDINIRTVSFVAYDRLSQSNQSIRFIDIALGNDPPVATDDTASTLEDTPINLSVLANDSDPNEDDLHISLVSDPAHGTAEIVSNDTQILYEPDNNFNGSDTLTYTISDSPETRDVDIGTVIVTVIGVNDPPQFLKGADQVVGEDAPIQTVESWATEISAGPTDDEMDQALLFLIETDNPGLFKSGPDIDPITGDLTFQSESDSNGVATVTVRLQDDGGVVNNGQDMSPEQTFTVTVNSVNDQPVAMDDLYNTEEDTPITFDPLENDFDIDNQLVPSTVTILLDPLNGEVEVNAGDGSVTYTPSSQYSGVDSLMYSVEDEAGAVSNQATIEIWVAMVNERPVATADSDTTYEDTETLVNVLDNDFDPDPEGGLVVETLRIETAPVHGLATIHGDTIRYQPDENFFGVDSLFYSVQDNFGARSDTSRVWIMVHPVNDAPTLTLGQPVTLDEDSEEWVLPDWATQISAGADNEIDQSLTLELSVDNEVLFSELPTIDLETGDLTFTPAPDSNGIAVVSAILRDDGGSDNGGLDSTEAQSFTITINPVNDPPSFAPQGPIVVYDDVGAQTVTSWATDISTGPPNEADQELNFEITGDFSMFQSAPELDPITGDLTFTPRYGFSGQVDLTVTVTDDDSGENSSTETLDIQIKLMGDVNADNIITIFDIAIMRDAILGIGDGLTSSQQEQADMNRDGLVDIRDIVLNVDKMN